MEAEKAFYWPKRGRKPEQRHTIRYRDQPEEIQGKYQ
jgi:hypothetical protein